MEDKKDIHSEEVDIELVLTDEEFQELNDRSEYHEWHWNMYAYMNSSIINGVSIIELKMNDFIADYFTFCDEEKSKQFSEYFLSKMNLQNKFVLFLKILPHINIEELGELNERDYKLLNKFDQIIKYRNLFAHSVLDQNYKNPKELKTRQRIKLQHLSAKNQKNNIRYITVKKHREMVSLLSYIDTLLRDIVLDTNTEKSTDIFFSHNIPDVQNYEPRPKANSKKGQ